MQPASPAPPPPTQQPDESGSSKDAHYPGSHKRKRRLRDVLVQYSSSSSDELSRDHEKSSPTSSPSKTRGGGNNNNATRNDAGKDQLVSSSSSLRHSVYALCDLINGKSGSDESTSSDTRRKLGECHQEPLIPTRELARRYEVFAKSLKSALEQQSDEAEATDLSTSSSTSSSHVSAFSGVAADNSRLGAETAAASTLNCADLFSAINELNRSSKLLATKSEVLVAAIEDITAQMTHLQCSFPNLSAASAPQPGGSAEFPPPSQSAGFDRVPPASSSPSRIQKVGGSPSSISASTSSRCSRSRGRPRLRHVGPSIRAQDRAAGNLSTRTAATYSHRRSVSSFGQQQSTLAVSSRLNDDQGSRGHIVLSRPNYRRSGGDAQPLEEVEPYALPPAMIMPPESSTTNEPSPPRHPSPFIKVEDEFMLQRASNLALSLLEDQNDSQVLSESLLPNAPCFFTTQYEEEEEESDDSYHPSIEDAAAAERQLLLEMSTAH